MVPISLGPWTIRISPKSDSVYYTFPVDLCERRVDTSEFVVTEEVIKTSYVCEFDHLFVNI